MTEEKKSPPTWNTRLLKQVTGVSWKNFQDSANNRSGFTCVYADVTLRLFGTLHKEGAVEINDGVYVTYVAKYIPSGKEDDPDVRKEVGDENGRRFRVRRHMSEMLRAYGYFVQQRERLRREFGDK